MREIATVLGGIGLLIFAYIAFVKNPQGVVQVAEGLAQSGATTISVLQGNSAGAIGIG